jgi:glyoxylase-like metal-dependent hydrolase (beta-lactamase superfamily II)
MTTLKLPAADTNSPIEQTTTCAPLAAGDDITVLPSYLPVPGLGVLPAHAFFIDGPEPMLVDAGPGGGQDAFQHALSSIVDPADLRWLWLTHCDPDHTGSLEWLLDNAPNCRIVTTYLAAGKLSMQLQISVHRMLWVNPGTTIEINGRTLTAFRPPSFDAPETVAFHDRTSSTLFTADAFGALLDHPVADASTIPLDDLADGLALWSTIDSPWVTHTDRGHFAGMLDEVRRLRAERVLSSHLPPASGITERLVNALATVPGRTPWTGPDQGALETVLHATSG